MVHEAGWHARGHLDRTMSLPKLYADTRRHNEAVRALFEADLDRPVLIVGNGPSAAAPDREHLRDDSLVFRMNWFFLEDQPRYGRRVDAFFWSIDTPALHDELAAVVARGDYDIRAFFSPMRPSERHGGRKVPVERFAPAFDHWAVIAESPTLAREMMGRPLPTQGFQALAFALALGYRDIRLAGIDLYSSAGPRYGHKVPDRIARRLASKDIAGGYESSHSRDRDLSFVATCRQQFPDARISALSDSPFLRQFERPAPLPIALETPPSPPEPPRHALVDGKKCAYATLLSPGPFVHGVRALARSLARVSEVPLVVMCLPGVDAAEIAAPNVVALPIEGIDNPNQLTRDSERFRHTYSKLAIFGLTDWDRLVYLDADAIVLQNIDELFAIDQFAAAPDLGIELHYERFNSGVFCCQPSRELFDSMLARLSHHASYDGGDQGFLNQFFPRPRLLDPSYNVLKRLYTHHPNLFRWDDVKVLHFTGKKPWETITAPRGAEEELEARWFEFVTAEEVVEMIRARTATWPTAEQVLRKLRKLRQDPVRFVKDAKLVRALRR